MKTKKRLIIFILSFIVMFFTCVNSVGIAYAEIKYSDVLTDLKKDETFDESYYIADSTDTSINVIQIGESNSELFIYTYQPSNGNKNLYASSITFSTSIGENVDYHNYQLKFINRNGIFNKYIVKDFVLKKDIVRYYDISSIYRPFDKDIDDELDYDNEITEVALDVGQIWSSATYKDQVSYSVVKKELVTVTHKFASRIDYFKGFNVNTLFGYNENTSGHFVSFSTDYNIDKLLEAQITFVEKKCEDKIDYSLPQNNYSKITNTISYDGLELTCDDYVNSSGVGLFGAEFSWCRIQTKSEFVAMEKDNLNSEALTEINKDDFVLRFYETDIVSKNSLGISIKNYSKIDEVAILRLKFVSDGKSYNLGVVDSKQNSTNDPAGKDNGTLDDLWETIEKILQLLALIIIVVICWPLIITIMPLIVKLLKVLLNIITWPFRALFRKNKRK